MKHSISTTVTVHEIMHLLDVFSLIYCLITVNNNIYFIFLC